MDDGMRVGLRALVQRAEWAAPAAGQRDAEACARRLRELGRELAGRIAGGEDRETWAHRATMELAEQCSRAVATWSADDVAELTRLRAAALIALAPAPGSADPATGADETSPQPDVRPDVRPSRALPAKKRAVVIGFAAVACAAVVGIIVTKPGGGDHAGAGASLPTTTPSQQPVGLASSAPSGSPGTGSTTTTTGVPTTTASVAASSPSSTSAASTAGGSGPAGDTARVTAIEMTATAADGYPEVQIYGTVTASGTGDITYVVTVTGASGAPQVTTEDESGQTSYALSQTLYLQSWCGQKSVTVTVSSGGVSRSSTVPVAGC